MAVNKDYGWNVTDCKSVLSMAYTIALLVPQRCLLYYQTVLKKSWNRIVRAISLKFMRHENIFSRAYNDALNIVRYRRHSIENNEVILSGNPCSCIQEYRSDLTFFTKWTQCLFNKLKGYHVTTGEPVCQPVVKQSDR